MLYTVKAFTIWLATLTGGMTGIVIAAAVVQATTRTLRNLIQRATPSDAMAYHAA